MRRTAAIAARDLWAGVLASLAVLAIAMGVAVASGWRLDGGFRTAAGASRPTASVVATPGATHSTAPRGTSEASGSSGASTGTSAGAGPSATTTGASRGTLPDLVWSREVSILVLGDGTADSDRTWIAAWARQVSVTHRVALSTWDPRTNAWASTARYGSGGTNVTMRDASIPGVSLRTSLGGSSPIVGLPPGASPDVVLVVIGRAETEDGVAASLEAARTVAAGLPAAPPLVVVAPPTTLNNLVEGVRQRAVDWAKAQGVAVIDIRAAATKNSAGQGVLTADPLEITDAGATFWARTLREQLGS